MDKKLFNLSAALSIDPLLDSIYALGSTTKNIKSLNLNNGVTDGGAIYFDDTTTRFLKSNTAGTVLDIGGFASITTVADAIGGASLLNTGVTGKTLTGFVSGPGSVSSADTILTALNKLDGNINYQMLAGGTGGYQGTFSFAGSDTCTSATFEDITNMVNQTFVTAVSGPHLIRLDANAYVTGAVSTVCESGIMIDGAAAVAVNSYWFPTLSAAEVFGGSIVVNLAAGSHTIRPQWRRVTGSGVVTADSNTLWKVSIQAQGAGINGLEIAEATLSSNLLINTAHPSWQATGIIVTFNTLANEVVNIVYSGNGQSISSGTNFIGYRIDGGTPQAINFTTVTGVWNTDMSFNVMSPALSAGQHTVEIMAKSFSTETWNLMGASTGYSESKLKIIRYKSNGLGAGTIVTKSTLSSDYTPAAANTIYDTGVSVAFNTIANEVVTLIGNGAITIASGYLGTQFLIELDGTVVHRSYDLPTGTSSIAGRFSIPTNFVTAPLSAGPHTAKLQVLYATASGQPVVKSTASLGGPTSLAAIQYRGGLIPVKDDGVSIVETPSALNFVGALVEQDGTEAKVTFPNAALGGIMQMLVEDYPTGNDDVTSTSYAALTGVAQQTLTTPVSGPHFFQISISGYDRFQEDDVILYQRIVLDKGTASEQIIGGDDWKWYLGLTDAATSYHTGRTFSGIVTLASGAHTVDWEAKVSGAGGAGGPSFRRNANTPAFMSVQAQGTGINGLEEVESTLASDFPVVQAYSATPGAGMAQVSTVQCTVTTLENERVNVVWNGTANLAADSTLVIGYQIDSDTAVPAKYLSQVAHSTSSGCGFDAWTAPLSAGTHIIKLMACKSLGTSTIYGTQFYTDSVFKVLRYKSNGIGAGTIVSGVALGSTFTIASAYPTFADVTGLTLTINTIANEVVEVSIYGNAWNSNTGSGQVIIGYQIDGTGTNYWLCNVTAGPSQSVNVSACVKTIPLTAGSHTIKLVAMKNTVSGTMTLVWEKQNYTHFQVTQHRGGLIPIKNNAVDVVTTPSDLDFTSDFAVTNPGALKAQIDLNCLDLTTALKVQPLADATYQLGDTAKNFFALYLDHGVTDGGAIYFNAGTTSFLKSNAAGTTLDIGGFTAVNVPGLTTIAGAMAAAGAMLYLRNTDATGYSAVACRDTSDVSKIVVGYGNPSVANAYLQSKSYIVHTVDLLITRDAANTDVKIDTSGNVFLGGTSLEPLTDANTALGAAGKSFKWLSLDNGATDGGAIYFNTATASFLKSTNDGAILNIDGFTSVQPITTNTIDLGEDTKRFKDIYYAGVLYGGSSPMSFETAETDGASAVGFQLTTENELVTDGSSVLTVVNGLLDMAKLRRGTSLDLAEDSVLLSLHDEAGDLGLQLAVSSSNATIECLSPQQFAIGHYDDFSYGAGYKGNDLVSYITDPYIGLYSSYDGVGSAYVEIQGQDQYNGGVEFHHWDTVEDTHAWMKFANNQDYLLKVWANSEDPMFIVSKMGVHTLGSRTVSHRDASLQAAILAANSLRTILLAHAADATEHPGGADTVSFVSMPVAATDLTTLIALVTYQLTSYTAHDTDAKAATPTYHEAQYAGSDLVSTTAPTTLAEALVDLLDLQDKYNAHDADATAHDTGSQHQDTNVIYEYATTRDDYIIGVSDTAETMSIVLLEADEWHGRKIVVKDKSGAANTNNITISTEGASLIDGQADATISANYGSKSFYFDGTDWYTI